MTDLVDTPTAARILGVPAATIRQWKARRRVAPAAVMPGPGRTRRMALWRISELQHLADEYHQRHATRHTGGQ